MRNLGILFFVAMMLSGCAVVDGTENIGETATPASIIRGKAGDTCEPSVSGTECDQGLYCATRLVPLDGGSLTQVGNCQKKLKLGDICMRSTDCEEPRADCSCLGKTCACAVDSKKLDNERCTQSLDCSSLDGINRVCVFSYCKRMRGEVRTASNQCESNECYGTPPGFTHPGYYACR